MSREPRAQLLVFAGVSCDTLGFWAQAQQLHGAFYRAIRLADVSCKFFDCGDAKFLHLGVVDFGKLKGGERKV